MELVNGVTGVAQKSEPHSQDEINELRKKQKELESKLELTGRIIKAFRHGSMYPSTLYGLRSTLDRLDANDRKDGLKGKEGEYLLSGGKLFGKTEQVGEGAIKRVYKAAYLDVLKGEQGVCTWIEPKPRVKQALVKECYDRLAKLEHKNIQRPFSIWWDSSAPRLIVLEKLRDTTLNGIAVPRAHVIPVVRQIVHAIAYLHKNLLLHGDIKLENILVSLEEELVVHVTDFDCSEKLSDKRARVKKQWGAVTHWSPECFLEQKVGLKADVWALALVVYQVLYRSFKDSKALEKFPPFVERAMKDVNWAEVNKGILPSIEEQNEIGMALCQGKIELDLPHHELVQVIKLGLLVEDSRCTAEEFLKKIPS